MAIDYDRTAPVLDNTNVDNIKEAQGQIDQFAALSFDMPDRDIINSLNQRIVDSESYWNDAKGFDLKNQRNLNVRMHLGKVDEKGLYKHQKQYKENQLFVSMDSIVSYVTAQIAGPQVIPAGREDMHRLFAGDLEKAIKCFMDDAGLESLVERWVMDIENKRIAVAHFYYDKILDDIVLEQTDPEHLILDKNTALGKNPGFICHVLKRTPEELIAEFPKKKKEIMEAFGIKRKTLKQMTREYAIRKVWVTHYNTKGEAEEGVVWYCDAPKMVLAKLRNPNFMYAKPEMNLLRYPKKPYIFGNLINYGTHLIDNTTTLEQAIPMQEYLMRRGRQIAENADKANGVLVISTKSGLTKDDGQNLVGDPNQKLFVDDDDGMGVEALVKQLQAQTLPEYVFQDKLDARMQIGNIMGAPTDFTGADTDESDPKVGIAMIKKNQASGRQDRMVRAITRMLSQIYEYLVQMMIVWYTEQRDFVYDAGDGEYDFIAIKRELIQKGIRVKASKPANPDRSRIEAIILKLLEQKAISLLDAYKVLQLDNAQQLYDNWAKQTADPTSLARDALDVVDESEAYVVFQDIMNGKPVDEKQNPSKEYILSLRKLMINDDFLTAKPKAQAAFIKYVNQCIDSLEERLALEQASDVSGLTAEGLRPGAPLPDPTIQPGAAMPGAPGMPPGGPGMPPAGPGGPMPPLQAGPGIPPPTMPMPNLSVNGVFAGTPVPAPGTAPAPQPGNPGSLPMM